jgi:hypothetical protein
MGETGRAVEGGAISAGHFLSWNCKGRGWMRKVVPLALEFPFPFGFPLAVMPGSAGAFVVTAVVGQLEGVASTAALDMLAVSRTAVERD